MAKRDMPVKKKPVEEPSYFPVKEDPSPIKLIVANCTKLNLREKPDKNSQILAKLPLGTVVMVDEIIDDWFHITGFGNEERRSMDSKPGYILAMYTSED